MANLTTYPAIWKSLLANKILVLVVEDANAEALIRRNLTYAKRDDPTSSARAYRIKSMRKIQNGKIELTFTLVITGDVWAKMI